MGGKRKRKHALSPLSGPPSKCPKLEAADGLADKAVVRHALLSLYYPEVLTLRNYLLSRLPSSSKSRRRRIVSLSDESSKGVSAEDVPAEGGQIRLSQLLDTTLVGVLKSRSIEAEQLRARNFTAFSQHLSSTINSTLGDGSASQSEIIDFAIWLLFKRSYHNVHRPLHLLCQGYQRANAPRHASEDTYAAAGIPGIVSQYPNSHVATLKSALWIDVLRLVGKEGEQIMLDLALDCGIFLRVDQGRDNYYQISGTPLPELSTLVKPVPKPSIEATREPSEQQRSAKLKAPIRLHIPSSINFVRNRMMYARVALNAKGEVRFGLRHIHVLNRYPDPHNREHTIHLMKYIFPRQFGLHNVFTSTVDSRETVQPFKDYTLREQEIAQVQLRAQARQARCRTPSNTIKTHLPKRLRGQLVDLIQKFQKQHRRCSYNEILKHYCPHDNVDRSHKDRHKAAQSITESSSVPQDQSTALSTRLNPEAPPRQFLVDAATPAEQVSTFCRAVLSSIIPRGLWGTHEDGKANENAILCYVDRFVHLRRFETLSLHTVFQGLKICNIPWLIPPGAKPGTKTSHSDTNKRKEIFLELVYYLFDSLLIPLIRCNFHVTESTTHRNRLFFFRHDIWRSLTERSLTTIKLSMFEELQTEKAKKLLDARTLGFSQIRLLPKGPGVRPIMNLRRRVTKLQNGKSVLGRSINSIMAPVFNMLSYEKAKQPDRLGSALFSVGDIYPKLKAFRSQIWSTEPAPKRLYFAKVDVVSCFDTIPQRRVIRLMEELASEGEYRIARHAEIKPSESHVYRVESSTVSKPARKFIANAKAANDFTAFGEIVQEELALGKKNTIFVDSVVQTFHDKENLLDLLEEHVERNIVKIGKKFFRQKRGIPQGSVLSSLLCNFFYAAFEKEHLGFLDGGESLLLRLIDDFLLITTSREQAKTFLSVMHSGKEEYGIKVKPEKTLVNFEITVDGLKLPCLMVGTAFPYCGSMIDTRTLEITKDRDRRKETAMADSLTVELSKTPGKTFHRKALNAFKIQTHAMFLDTTFNSLGTVLATTYQNFVESAMKYYRYAKSMGRKQQPQARLLIRTIGDLIDLAHVLIQSRNQKHGSTEYHCAVSRGQIQWLAATAFRHVLGKKQSSYGQVIAWLDDQLTHSPLLHDAKEATRMRRIANKGNALFGGYKF